MPLMQIRDVSLFVEVVGSGPPVLVMHGGPSADHWTLAALRRCADQATLVFYDHRCNGRSEGAPVSSMTWDNLTADADALRERLGFDRWTVLGHSFGGHVALEYALRYPGRVAQLVLVDTAADSRWSQQNAPRVLEERGWPPAKVELCRRWFNGAIEPREAFRTLMTLGPAYYHRPSLITLLREVLGGSWRTKLRPEALIFAGQHLMPGWSIVDRLAEIRAPTLVVAGASDFIFPPAAQRELAAGIPQARLHLIEGAGHEPWSEQPAAFFSALRAFLPKAPARRGNPQRGGGSGSSRRRRITSAIDARRPARSRSCASALSRGRDGSGARVTCEPTADARASSALHARGAAQWLRSGSQPFQPSVRTREVPRRSIRRDRRGAAPGRAVWLIGPMPSGS